MAKLGVAFILLLSATEFLVVLRADEPAPTVELKMSKSSFLQHEPLEIQLRLFNPGPATIEVGFEYPDSPYTFNMSGLSLDAEKAGLKALKPLGDVIGGGLRAVPRVKPGSSYSAKVYLQRFIKSPPPGRYSLPYEAAVPFETEDGGQRNFEKARAKGELVFTVLPRDDKKLAEVFDEYLTRAKDWRNSREPIEALSVIDDPIVVGHLVKLAESPNAEVGLRALARFKHVEEARLAVEDALNAKRHLEVGAALKILTEWKQELSVRQVRQLLDRKNDWITGLVTAYVDAMGQEKYRKLLPAEYASARASTAIAAIEISKAVFLEHEPIEFQVSLQNQGPGPISPHLQYPSFLTYASKRKLDFDLSQTNLTAAPLGWGGLTLPGDDRSSALQPGEKLTRRCYLQRHVVQPPPGKYRLPFTFEATYLVGRPVFDTEKVATVKGELAFTVLPKDRGNLDKILQGFAEKARDQEQGGQAVEALVVISDPIVVSYLVKLLQNGRDAAPLLAADRFGPKRFWLEHQLRIGYQALAGLARFKDMPAARDAVLETLHNKNGNDVNRALRILGDWKHEIPVEQLKEIIGRNNNYLTADIERYVKAIGREDYKKLLPK